MHWKKEEHDYFMEGHNRARRILDFIFAMVGVIVVGWLWIIWELFQFIFAR